MSDQKIHALFVAAGSIPTRLHDEVMARTSTISDFVVEVKVMPEERQLRVRDMARSHDCGNEVVRKIDLGSKSIFF